MSSIGSNKSALRLPLRLVFTVLSVMIILVTVGLTDYLAFRNGQAAVNDMVTQLFTKIDENVKQHLDNYLGTAFIINQLNLNAMRQGQLNGSDTEQMAQYFWQQGQIFQGLGSMGFGNDNGDLAAANEPEKYMIIAGPTPTGIVLRRYAVGDDGRRSDKILREVQNFDVHEREWYQIAVKAKQPSWTQIRPALTGPRLDVSAVTPYYDEGRLQGVFYLDVSLAQINQFLKNINISQRGHIFIMEPGGFLVASSTPGQPYIINGDEIKRLNASASSEPMIAYAARYLEGQFADLSKISGPYQSMFYIQGERYYVRVSPYHDPRRLDWYVVLVVPESDFMASINTSYYNTILLIIGSVILSIVAAFLMARWVTRPLSDLSLSARALAQGDLDQKLDLKRSDEVGELSDAFNTMTVRLKENMASLRESEERFRALVEMAPEAILVFDAEKNLFVDANKNAELLFGCSREELQKSGPQRFYSSLQPDKRSLDESMRDNIQRALAGETVTTERVVCDIKGKEHLCQVWLTRLPSVRGKLIRVSYVDITGRKLAEKKLREASLYSRSLIEVNLDLLVTINMEGEITDVNNAAELVTGFPREKLIGSDFSGYVTEPEKAVEGFHLTLKQGFVRDFPLSIRHTSGKVTDVLFNASVYKNEAGEVQGVFAAARDITERKRAQEALREREVELIEAQRIAQVGSWDWVTKTDTVIWSQELYRIADRDTKLPAPTYKEQHNIYTPESMARLSDVVEKALQTGASYELEIELVRPDGTIRWITARGEAKRDASGQITGLRGTVHDITENKRAEDELQKLYQELEIKVSERTEQLARTNEALQIKIAQLIKADEELQKSNRQQLAILNNIPDIAWLKDKESRFIAVNKPFADACGVSQEELIGKNDLDIWPQELADRYRADDREVMTTGRRKQVQEPLKNREGEESWIETIKTPIYNNEGDVIGTTGIARNITERKLLEEELQRAHDELEMRVQERTAQLQKTKEFAETVLNNMEDIISIIDVKDFRILNVNTVFLKKYDLRKEEIIGKTCHDIIHKSAAPCCPPDHICPLLDTLKTGKNTTVEHMHFMENGEKRYVAVSTSPIKDENQKVVSVIHVVRDITDHKRADEALEKSEMKYRMLFEDAGDYILIISADLNRPVIIDANTATFRHMGYTREELIGKAISEIGVPGNYEKNINIVRNKIKKPGDSCVFESSHIRKDGSIFHVEVLIRMLQIGDEPPFLFSIERDITRRKASEEIIEASLKEKEILLREIHHRVKNNMQIISSLLKLQAETIKDEKYLDMFKESQNRILAMSLVHEKLYKTDDFSRINARDYIKSVVNSIIQSYAIISNLVSVNCMIEDITIGMDSAIPCGLIINELVTNSVKYAFPDGKRGIIEVMFRKIGEKEFELIVRDNGIGFPDNFDFRNTETLGLHLVLILAENQLSGKIDLDRSKGIQFMIRFKEHQ